MILACAGHLRACCCARVGLDEALAKPRPCVHPSLVSVKVPPIGAPQAAHVKPLAQGCLRIPASDSEPLV